MKQKPKAEKLVEEKLGDFSDKETGRLIKDFQTCFKDCVKACKKPNILVTGITGVGKSSIINSIFGSNVTNCGVGLPITQVFEKFEPKDKPIVIYDSKGLEWNEQEKFIKETTKFFNVLRSKKDISEHIHCIWYVINGGRGRIDDFELKLLKKVFYPTPVVFILNKSDLADAEQIKSLLKVIEDEEIPSCKGVFVTVANRKTYTQSWCVKCHGDDVFYDEETKELECVSCKNVSIMEKTLGLQDLVKLTCDLLPEFAKDAFQYCQQVSQVQKDKRAKDIVTGMTKEITLDIKGNFIVKVAQMCARLFVIWGYPLTADQFSKDLEMVQAEYVTHMKFQERLLITSLDTLFRRKISKAFSAILGLTMNKGMKRLNEKLIEHTREGTIDDIDISDFMKTAEIDEMMVMLFFETSLFQGVDKAIDMFWCITSDELEEIRKKSKVLGEEGLMKMKGMNIQENDVLYSVFSKIEEQKQLHEAIEQSKVEFEDLGEKKEDNIEEEIEEVDDFDDIGLD